MTGWLRRLDRRLAIALFVAFACLYLLSAGGHLYSSDDQQKFDTLLALWQTGSPEIPDGWARGIGRSRFAWFPLGASLWMLPGFLVGKAALWLWPGGPVELPRFGVALANTIWSALLVAGLFMAARLTGFSRRRSLFAAAAMGLGTMVWPYAKSAWSEPGAALCLYGGLFALWLAACPTEVSRLACASGSDQDPEAQADAASPRLYLVAGSGLGLACLIRQELAIAVEGALLWLLWRARERVRVSWGALLVPLALSALVSLGYDLYRYASITAAPSFNLPQKELAIAFSQRLAYGATNLYRYLLHPNQGLLWFSPAIAAGILGWAAFARAQGHLSRLLLASLVPLLAFYLVGWGTSSWSWGVRYSYMLVPALMLAAAATPTKGLSRLLLALMLPFGLAVQLLALPFDFGTLYLREIQRVPYTTIREVLNDPLRGPLVLAIQALPNTLEAGLKVLMAPPRATSLSDASRVSRRNSAPDLWWLLVPGGTRLYTLSHATALGLLLLGFLALYVLRPAWRRRPMRVPGVGVLAVYGTYDPDTPRTKLLLAGWEAHGGVVRRIQAPFWPPAGARALAAQRPRVLRRVAPWLRAQRQLWRNRHHVAGADVLLVPYPGYFDLLTARWIADTHDVPLLYDPFISLYDTAILDRRLFPEDSLTAQVYLAIDRHTLRIADRVLVDTRPDGQRFRQLGRLGAEAVAVVPVGADDALFDPTRYASPHEPLEVLFYGRMAPLHGIPTLIAAAQLLADDPRIRFTVIGEGQVPIQALIAAAPEARINWHPAVSYDELPAWLAGSDICLGVFGASEKTGLVVPHKVYEAAAMGKAIVTRDGPAIRDAFAATAIALVPPADPQALAAALRELADDPARRTAMGAAVQATSQVHFGRQGIGAALLAALPFRPDDR